jgi:hypothetical protein
MERRVLARFYVRGGALILPVSRTKRTLLGCWISGADDAFSEVNQAIVRSSRWRAGTSDRNGRNLQSAAF